MAPFEQLAVAYFLVLLVGAYRAPSWRRGALYACGAILLIIVARLTLPWAWRAWAPLAYLLLGYWIPAAFVDKPNEAFERWLGARHVPGTCLAPTWHLAGTVLELAYLCCYPLVPAAFAIVFMRGSTEDVIWFWLVTLGAGYACYVSLPWVAARPPRLLRPDAPPAQPRPLAALNAMVLGRVSHQMVTFPSGHVAVSLAAALGVWRVWPEAGAVFSVVALLIGIAAVTGRYHYAIDVVFGFMIGGLMAAVTQLVV
jgi:membrane-associated phospholipid phosphatase